MTDKELLEMAAKAAGIEIMRSRLHDPLQGDMLVKMSSRNNYHENGPWNPLTDDGDALRLAVKCGISLTMKPLGCVATDFGLIDAYERHGDDPSAATRRAIVRAAAAIGEQMQ